MPRAVQGRLQVLLFSPPPMGVFIQECKDVPLPLLALLRVVSVDNVGLSEYTPGRDLGAGVLPRELLGSVGNLR